MWLFFEASPFTQAAIFRVDARSRHKCPRHSRKSGNLEIGRL